MKVWEEEKDFLETLLADTDVVGALGEAKLREAFNLNYHLKHVDTIFKRVFEEE
jgi:adenylosuccinate lyase